MIPYLQTEFDPGNCLQACVAALLELPMESVPHFFAGTDESNYAKGWRLFDKWFEDFGIYAKHESTSTKGSAWVFPHLASGLSPRDVHHQVIREGFDIIHDPHPDGGGVEVDQVTNLIVCDPTKLWKLRDLQVQAQSEYLRDRVWEAARRAVDQLAPDSWAGDDKGEHVTEIVERVGADTMAPVCSAIRGDR